MAHRICSISGCEKKVFTRSWCQMHYKRWLSDGDPGPAVPICSILDCDKAVRDNGMCSTHSGNKRKYGHAIPLRDWPFIARLMDVGWDVDERGCWVWRGARNESGYALISLRRRGDGPLLQRVSRLMWGMHSGPIPDGHVVRHRCDNPTCVNPDHLLTGTKRQNTMDMVERKRGMAYDSGRYGGRCKTGKHDATLPGALKEVHTRGKPAYLTCVKCDQERKRKFEARKKAEKAAREAPGEKAA